MADSRRVHRVLPHSVEAGLSHRSTAINRASGMLLLAFLGISLAVPASAAGDPQTYAHGLFVEHQGRLSNALPVLQRTARTAEQKHHVLQLRRTIAAIGAANAYRRLREYTQAEQVLDALIPKLDPVRDV